MTVIKYQKHYGPGFFLSLGIHGVLIALLTLSIQSGGVPSTASKASPTPQNHEIIQATVVDEKLVAAEVKRLEVKEKQHKEEIQKAALAKQEREKEQAKIAQLKKELAKAKVEEENHLAEIKIAKEKERKQLEALRLEKEKEQKRLAALDEKRQEEQERAETMRLQREQEEKKQKQLEAKKAEKALAREREAQATQRQGFLNSELARFQALLRDKVNGAWHRAPGLPEGLACMLEIRLLPDGTVAGVQVMTSSGNLAFDQAALAAVSKASPLPVPTDAELLDKFRHFTFEFRPPEVM